MMEGFQAKVAVKHLSGNGEKSEIGDNGFYHFLACGCQLPSGKTSTWVLLTTKPSRLMQTKALPTTVRGAKDYSEDLWGVVAQYAFTDTFSARISYQEAGDVTASQDDIEATSVNDDGDFVASGEIDNLVGIGATYEYGMGEIYGDYYHVEMIDDRNDDQNRWVLGAKLPLQRADVRLSQKRTRKIALPAVMTPSQRTSVISTMKCSTPLVFATTSKTPCLTS